MSTASGRIICIVAILLGQTFTQTSIAASIPLPVERPVHMTPKEVQKAPDPEQKPEQQYGQIETRSKNSCLVELNKIAKAISVSPTPPKDPECIISNPVSILSISIPNGTITLPANMLNKCEFALEFTRWVADVANPLARQHLGSPIAKLHSGTGFTCRRRNNLPTGKLSEHAFGNAIDIIGLTLKNGDRFSVEDPAGMEPSYARFFAALRKTACGYFTTVLGPGSNAAHATHLHLDLGIHGKSGNYRICE